MLSPWIREEGFLVTNLLFEYHFMKGFYFNSLREGLEPMLHYSIRKQNSTLLNFLLCFLHFFHTVTFLVQDRYFVSYSEAWNCYWTLLKYPNAIDYNINFWEHKDWIPSVFGSPAKALLPVLESLVKLDRSILKADQLFICKHGDATSINHPILDVR